MNEEEAARNWPWLLYFTPLFENGEKLFEIMNEATKKHFDKVTRVITQEELISERYAGIKFFRRNKFVEGKFIFEINSYQGDSDSNGCNESFRVTTAGVCDRVYYISFQIFRNEFYGDSSAFEKIDFSEAMQHPRLRDCYSKFIEDVKTEVRKLDPGIKFQPH